MFATRQNLAGALALLMCSNISWAAPSEVVRDWTVRCDEARKCHLAQVILDDGQRFLALVRLWPAAEGARLEVVVPVGTHLASGVFIATGQPNPRQLDWITCDLGVCLAVSDIGADELQAWRRARTASLRYRPSMESGVVEFKVSLMGLTRALQVSQAGVEQ